MSFSRYKALVRLARISPHSTECNHQIGVRSYCRKVIFSSASPQEFNVIAENPAIEELKHEKEDAEEATSNLSHKHQRKNRHQKALSNQEEIHKFFHFQQNQILSDKRNLHLSDKDKSPNLKSEYSEENETRRVFKLKHKTDTTDAKNVIMSPVEDENLNSESNDQTKIFQRYKILETPEGKVKYDLSIDEFNVDKFVQKFNESMPGPLDECEEDLSDFGPNFVPTFNFAAYADKSELIQGFVKLGVKLWKVERNQDHMRALLSVDMKNELPVYIQFLHDSGVSADSLGDVITDNPMILKEDLDDMKTRIRYLRAHDFEMENIARIITKNPSWLLWATKCIDERLGHFQNEFHLTGSEVRFLAAKQPKLITYNFKHILENTFAIREEMGFNSQEMKVILLAKPRLWMNSRKKIVDTFDYLHNTMKLSHLTIASQPDVLTCRRSRIKNRHEFLMELKKDQYDPIKPGYIAPKSIVFGSDVEFCRDVAKAALETYNLFLKTR